MKASCSRRRAVGSRVLLLALATAALGVAALTAEPLRLRVEPQHQAISSETITIELEDAAVEVIFDPAAEEAFIEAGLYEGRPGTVSLDLRQEGGGITVGRSTVRRRPGGRVADGKGAATPFWMVLVTPGARRLEVRGQRLNLTVAALASPAPPAPPDAPEGAVEARLGRGAARTQIALQESEIRLSGRHHGSLELEDSRLEIVEAGGALELALDGSSADVESLNGRLTLEGTHAEVRVVALQGVLEYDLHDSDLVVQDGGGTVTGNATGSLVILDSWRGNATLGGRESAYEVRSIRDRESRLDVGGRALTVIVSAFLGDLHADLEGGSLTGSGLSGTTVIRARERASLDLQDLDRLLELQLGKDTTARVSRMGGRMKVSMDGAYLTADLIRILEINARGSQVDATRVRRMGTANVSDTRLDLDLSTVESHPAILIRGETVAQVRLPTPCSVRLAGETPDLERRLRVRGCELQVPGQKGSAKFNEQVITLKTSLEGESFLEVTGSGSR